MSLIERHLPANKTDLIDRRQKLTIKQMHVVDSFDANYALARPIARKTLPQAKDEEVQIIILRVAKWNKNYQSTDPSHWECKQTFTVY